MFRRRPLVSPSPELLKRGTSLAMEVLVLAQEIGPDRKFDTDLRLQATEGQLHRLCPDYRPSRLVVLGVEAGRPMCRSGENSAGRPYRDECPNCLAGQFSPTTGIFLGLETQP